MNVMMAPTTMPGKCRKHFLLLILAVFVAEIQGQATIARLVGGLDEREGRVEILHDGVWGTICDDNWSENEAAVICRMIGYPGPSRAADINLFGIGASDVPVWLDSVSCTGNEANIDLCQSRGWGQADCTHTEDAAATCLGSPVVVPPVTSPPSSGPTTTTPPPVVCNNPQTDIRLVGGSYAGEGIVEILNPETQTWGTICDDDWGMEDARVVCRSLCFEPTLAQAILTREFGNAVNPFLLNNVDCNGAEFTIQTCPSPGYNQNVNLCSAEEAAAVRCYEQKINEIGVPAPVVECTDDTIVVRFDKTKDPLLRTDFIDLLTDPIPTNCQYTERNEALYIVAVIPFIQCGTTRELNTTHIIYKNTIVHNIPSSDPVITRNTEFLIEVSCVVARTAEPERPNIAPQSNSAPPQTGEGEFAVDMSMYINNNYEAAVPSYPVPVTLGDWVYVGLNLRSIDPGLKLVVPECYATPTNDPNSLRYTFIENKCRIETTVSFYPLNQTMFGFRFQSFKFLEGSPMVYVHCQAYICVNTETTEACDRSCKVSNLRKKRGVEDNEIDEDLRGIVEIERGPLVIMDDVRWLEESNLDRNMHLSNSELAQEIVDTVAAAGPSIFQYSRNYLVLLICLLVLI